MKQLIRFGLVGVASNAAIYLVYLIITYTGVESKKAMTMVYIVGATIGYIGNQRWTFAHRGDTTRTALRYVLTHLFGYLINYLILFTLVDYLGYAHQWAQAVAIIIVAGFLFMAFKHFVFHESITRTRQT